MDVAPRSGSASRKRSAGQSESTSDYDINNGNVNRITKEKALYYRRRVK